MYAKGEGYVLRGRLAVQNGCDPSSHTMPFLLFGQNNRNLALICPAATGSAINSTRVILLRNELPNVPYPFAAPGGGGGDPDGGMNLVKLTLGVADPAAAPVSVSGGAAAGGTPSRKKLFE